MWTADEEPRRRECGDKNARGVGSMNHAGIGAYAERHPRHAGSANVVEDIKASVYAYTRIPVTN